jgi:hypothetical protein
MPIWAVMETVIRQQYDSPRWFTHIGDALFVQVCRYYHHGSCDRAREF